MAKKKCVFLNTRLFDANVQTALLKDLLDQGISKLSMEFRLLRSNVQLISKDKCSLDNVGDEELEGFYENPAYNVFRIFASKKAVAFSDEIGYKYFDFTKYFNDNKYTKIIKSIPMKLDLYYNTFGVFPIDPKIQNVILNFNELKDRYKECIRNAEEDILAVSLLRLQCKSTNTDYLSFVRVHVLHKGDKHITKLLTKEDAQESFDKALETIR